MRPIARTLTLAVIIAPTLWLAGVGSAAAQPAVTASDVERLDDRLFEAGTAIARLRTGDAVLRKELLSEVEDVRAAVRGLDGRLRAGEPVAWDAYTALRRRITEVKRRARSHVTVTGWGGGPTARAPYPSAAQPPRPEIPAGLELEARLLSSIDPETARRGDPVEAATVAAYSAGGEEVVPAGSLLRGTVHVRRPESGRAAAAPRVTVTFEDVLVAFTTHPIDAALTAPVGGPLRVGALVRLRFD